MAACLTAEEEQATKQFLEEINKWTTQHGVSPLSWNVAVKFLMARKFDVLRAIELFHSYRETRLKEGIVKLQPQEEPLRSELLSGKFTVLSVRDPSGASIALYTARLHHPNQTGNHVVLQALFYLLDRAVESFETQRNGLVFIYDMAGSNYTNFELDLSKKILNLLKGAFPARLKKVFIVGAPVWFRVPYNLLSLLLKEKLRERVQMVKMADLRQHLPRDCLPEHLGGLLALDAHGWNRQLLAGQNGRVDPVDELVGIPLEEGSIHTPGPEAMRLTELLAHLGRVQRAGIHEEYEEIRKETPPGTFHSALAAANQERNRYGDVLCLDQTRVRLKPRRNEKSDYINASFMDGYKQKNAYIGTQGPLEKTYAHFWRMIWEQNVLVIVMTTRTDESGRRKCGQYWPLEEGGQEVYGHIAVVNQRVDSHTHYNQTTLELHNTENCEQRQVTHFQYLSWPDYGVPTSAITLIDFLGAVKMQQRKALKAMGPQWKGHHGGPPMVVHCSAGIGRTGTLCALDICLSQLQDVGTLNICQTVRRMRTQRAFSIQTPEQYYFCHTAILEHAQQQGNLTAYQ
ncbi:tyrosine-protein phosphatase non-receptor type 9 [Megalops cyprinoides]|uniref:tyrosine-protein phosphatase non-receptor type 9 n=1 Tax=Megalops cyprinoides TaxID=118141 RepID=UPI0018656990|nr:tyrosine-protein phosphatase non-receptor type 9 [Megalops cyprinoides]XP_036390946.1 tyrosine-protein phosphatase non-receptor type 9 [Megalops cyprinoides]